MHYHELLHAAISSIGRYPFIPYIFKPSNFEGMTDVLDRLALVGEGWFGVGLFNVVNPYITNLSEMVMYQVQIEDWWFAPITNALGESVKYPAFEVSTGSDNTSTEFHFFEEGIKVKETGFDSIAQHPIRLTSDYYTHLVIWEYSYGGT